jgi:haloalkane dehalogenase
MKVVRTPKERFENLKDYPFKPNYIAISEELNMHYVDEGKGKTVLLFHGEPSWSYLYRKMIPILVKNGFRVIAPDLIGFGKSDKPTEQTDYSYQNHLDWLTTFIEKMNLTDINLFCQDWGGILGLHIAANHQDKFSSIIAANTFLPNGQSSAPEAFKKWKAFSQKTPDFQAGFILQGATVSDLCPEVVAAYDAPFPTDEYKAGARIFPTLVPFGDDDPYKMIPSSDAAWGKLVQWKKPFLTLFSDSDPIMNGLEKVFQKLVPGAQNQPHQIIEKGGHFLQEDKGEELAELMSAFIKDFRQ